jgi:hypothetical protein
MMSVRIREFVPLVLPFRVAKSNTYNLLNFYRTKRYRGLFYSSTYQPAGERQGGQQFNSVRINEQILIFEIKQWFFSGLPPAIIQHKAGALDIKNLLSNNSIKSR